VKNSSGQDAAGARGMLFQQQTVFTIRGSNAIEFNIREFFRQRKNSFAARITTRQTAVR
jgi:hypothetical protein